MESGSSLKALIDKVEALCEAGLNAAKPYLVSSLGLELGDDLQQLKSLTKMNLAEFIRTHLGEKYEIARLGEHNNVLAVVEKGSEPPTLVRHDGDHPIDSQGRPKFHYRLWAAFSVPPTHPYRVLNLVDLTFNDVSEKPADLEEDQYIIPLDKVPSAEAPRRDDVIYENLNGWLKGQQLVPSRFYARNDRPSKQKILKQGGLQRGSLLEALLQCLDRKQLQNTSLTLDVVEALHRTGR